MKIMYDEKHTHIYNINTICVCVLFMCVCASVRWWLWFKSEKPAYPGATTHCTPRRPIFVRNSMAFAATVGKKRTGKSGTGWAPWQESMTFKVQLYFRSWSSVQHVKLGNSLTTEEQNILYILHIYISIHHDYTRLYKITQDGFPRVSPRFSWCFPVFPTFSSWFPCRTPSSATACAGLQATPSTIDGPRRPSGPKERLRQMAWWSMGTTMGTTRSQIMAMNAMTFLVEVTQVFCWCILYLRGWKWLETPARFY
jgi:hypothetical protein